MEEKGIEESKVKPEQGKGNVEEQKMRRPSRLDKRLRNKVILDLLSKPVDETGILTQEDLRNELRKVLKYEYTQGAISKILDELEIKKLKDGIGFDISGSKTRIHNVEELKKIASECFFDSESVITSNTGIFIIKSKNIAYSHILSKHLKVMYPNIIIDTICNDNSIIVFHNRNEVFEKRKLTEDLKKILPNTKVKEDSKEKQHKKDSE